MSCDFTALSGVILDTKREKEKLKQSSFVFSNHGYDVFLETNKTLKSHET